MTDRNYPCGDDSSENLYQPIKKKNNNNKRKTDQPNQKE